MARTSALDKAIQHLESEIEAMNVAEAARQAAHVAAIDAKYGAINTLKALQQKPTRKAIASATIQVVAQMGQAG